MSTSKHLFIDVSHWQGEGGMALARWRALAKCRVRAAIIKASQGTGFVDDAVGRNVARARKVGMEVGLYHFLDASDPERQAAHFLRTAKRANTGKDARGRDRAGTLRDLLLVVDVERNPGAGGSPRGYHVRRFLRAVRKRAPRNTLLVYSGEGYWRAIGNPDMRDEADGLWQARWDGRKHRCKAPNLPAQPPRAGFGGWNGRPAFWQFGALRYQVAGKGYRLDGNAFYGGLGRLRALFRTVDPVKPEPEPPVPPDAETWREQYNALVGVAHGKILAIKAKTEAELEARADALATLEALHIAAGDPGGDEPA